MFMKNFALFISFLILYGLFPAKAQNNDISTGEEAQNERLATYIKQYHQAAGIALEFHKWPDKEEKETILRYTKENGLKKARTITFYKGWAFEWVEEPKLPKNPKTLNDLFSASSFIATKICMEFPKLNSVKDCIADSLLFPPLIPGELSPGVYPK